MTDNPGDRLEFLVRNCAADDLSEITKIYERAVRGSLANAEQTAPDLAEMTRRYRTLVDSGYPYLVAETTDGAIAAFAFAGPFRAMAGFRPTVETSIYVADAHLRRGIGRALLAQLIERAGDAGFRQMMAVIEVGQTASIELHKALGFEKRGLLPDVALKHDQWMTVAILQRTLDCPANGASRKR